MTSSFVEISEVIKIKWCREDTSERNWQLMVHSDSMISSVIICTLL